MNSERDDVRNVSTADVILFIISLIVVGMLCIEVLSTFPLVWKNKCIRERNQAIEDKNVYRDFDKFMWNPLFGRMILKMKEVFFVYVVVYKVYNILRLIDAYFVEDFILKDN